MVEQRSRSRGGKSVRSRLGWVLPAGKSALARLPAPGPAGFTLIELMIAVAVVGILTVLALPGYTASVNKSRRAECHAALVNAAQIEERYFTSNNSYDSLPVLGAPTFSGNAPAGSACTLVAVGPAPITAGVAVSTTALAGPSPGFIVVATPQGWTDTQCNSAAYAIDSRSTFAPLDASNVPLASPPAGCF